MARSRSSSRARPLGSPLRAASPPTRVRLPVSRFLCADPCVRPHEPGGPGRLASSADPGWLHRCPAPLSLQANPPLDQVSLASSLSLFLLKRSKACMWRVLLSPALYVFLLKRFKTCMWHVLLSPALFAFRKVEACMRLSPTQSR